MTVEIRERRGPAVEAHAEIEHAADDLFRAHFGLLPWNEDAPEHAPHGYVERVFDAVDGATLVGFAKVIVAGEYLHLEQLSVSPDHSRRGIGGRLVDTVLSAAWAEGFQAVSLRTFAEVPWNAPFYERHGFHVVDAVDTEFHAGLAGTEESLGLMEHGARVHMLAQRA
ncbi:GNAT family N-acetyltransferase [Leucobacter aridicollis]|uniref:GNAT family N-acetyltransferase n=1 Tax=Leucobacter aridicollis TaxID=283878 RepID=UPI0021024A80|nr:GNAT family N-acetyltransferase [Leucobacter aridicollis]UTX54273.1 GNAT family N-acetyltransferase [Leucobacter aridicollis]